MSLLKRAKKVRVPGESLPRRSPEAGRLSSVPSEEDAGFQALFQQNPQPMWFFDPNSLQLLEVNEAAVSHYGYSREEFVGMSLSELRPQEDVPHSLGAISRAGKGGRCWGEWKHRLKNGKFIDVEIFAHSVDFRGSEAYLALVRDITKQKEAESSWRQAESKYRQIFEDAMVGIFQTTPDGRILSANPAMARMYGVASPEEFVMYVTDVQIQVYVDPSGRAEARRLMEEEGGMRNFEVQVYRKDRSKMWLSVTGRAVREAGAVVRYEGTAEDITERKRLVEDLLNAQEQYREIFDNAVVGVFQSTPEGRYVTANPAMAKMLGYDSPEELIGSVTNIGTQVYVDPNFCLVLHERVRKEGAVKNLECEVYRKDGSKAWFSANLRATFQAGQIVRYEGMNEDITQRKLLENQLRQSQKMEAVGLLAGGVAHDFNNSLGVIIGYSDLLQISLPPQSASHKHAEEIAKAGRRAAALTRQLLAFSRKQVIQPVVLDLNAATRELEKMLQRLIGEHIEITLQMDPGLGPVKMDPGQVEQILMNLCVNAQDAMPDGGKLCIQTANAELDAAFAKQTGFVLPGSYVMLSVSDTGCGMGSEVQRRIFEPFFTTKEPGKGTGLGLSTVYGIAKQNGGYIIVCSELGKGSTFQLYLPRLGEGAGLPAEPPVPEPLPVGIGTVMVVEDEGALRTLVCTCLESNGYNVLDAPDAATALWLAERDSRRIDLLLSDLVMPGMGGPDLANRMRVLHPKVRVLFMSGYTNDRIGRNHVLESGTDLLEKPFTLHALLGRVGRVLHRVESDKAVAARPAHTL